VSVSIDRGWPFPNCRVSELSGINSTTSIDKGSRSVCSVEPQASASITVPTPALAISLQFQAPPYGPLRTCLCGYAKASSALKHIPGELGQGIPDRLRRLSHLERQP
jgi:hypothetical protein